MKEIGLLLVLAAAAMIPGILIFKVNEGLELEAVGDTKKQDWRKLLPIMLFAGFGAGCMSHFYYGRTFWQLLPTVVLLAQLWPLAYTDRYSHLITNKSLLVMLLTRLPVLGIEFFLLRGYKYIVYILVTCAIGAVAMMIASFLCRLVAPGSVGFGDVKLLGVVGLYLGTDRLPAVILPSLLALFFVSVYLLTVKKVDKKTELAFAPFLLIGTLLGMFLMAA